MRIRLANRIGFCFGVKRAIEMAEAILKEGAPIYPSTLRCYSGSNPELLSKDSTGSGLPRANTAAVRPRMRRGVYSLGSIIHNKQVVGKLAAKGLKVVSDVGSVKEGTVVISSHGISPKVAENLKRKGIRIVDTTCPFVLNAQETARSLSEVGYRVIIVGDVEHPEVKALIDFASGKAVVIKDKKEAGSLKLKDGEKISVISQTTQSMDNFLDVCGAILKKRPKEIRIFNTICRDAEERQEAARKLAKKVDVMLVVGGHNSANTRRLYEVCKKILSSSYLVETEADLCGSWFKGGLAIGITSGASTPDWIVKKVVNKIKKGR